MKLPYWLDAKWIKDIRLYTIQRKNAMKIQERESFAFMLVVVEMSCS
jgi:hypothetical protein